MTVLEDYRPESAGLPLIRKAEVARTEGVARAHMLNFGLLDVCVDGAVHRNDRQVRGKPLKSSDKFCDIHNVLLP